MSTDHGIQDVKGERKAERVPMAGGIAAAQALTRLSRDRRFKRHIKITDHLVDVATYDETYTLPDWAQRTSR